MTDLLSPLRRAQAPDTGRRPLNLSALLAGLAAPGSVLLVCWAIGLVGWFAADGGSHGTTRSALRIGADTWLLAHGANLQVGAVTVTASPLGLTLLCGYVTFRFGRWAAESSAVEDLRSVGLGTVVLSGVYGVVTLLTAVLASVPNVQPSLGLSFVGGALMGGAAGGLGLLSGAGLVGPTWRRFPVTGRSIVLGAAASTLLMITAGAALVALALGLNGSAAANVLAQLHPDTTGAVLSLLLLALITPNVILMGSAYLLGPGFAVGTGTIVAPSQVVLGPVPAVPVLAALPQSGPGPAWAGVLVALPVLVGALAAYLAARRLPTRRYEVAAGRGLGAGVLGAIALAVLMSLAGGAVGPGRMTNLGAPVLEVFGVALAALGCGGAAGAVLATWWRRRTIPEDADHADSDHAVDDSELTVSLDLSSEDTVTIPTPRTLRPGH